MIVALKRPCSFDSKQPSWSVVNLQQHTHSALLQLVFSGVTLGWIRPQKRESLGKLEQVSFKEWMFLLPQTNRLSK